MITENIYNIFKISKNTFLLFTSVIFINNAKSQSLLKKSFLFNFLKFYNKV